MIAFDNVRFSRGERTVLKGLSFSVEEYERAAILGGSGEGKTTILRLIMGLLRPDSGRILIDGEDITFMSESRLRKVRTKFSIVFQEGALFDSLDVYENVAFPLRENSPLSEEEIDGKVRALLRTVGMEDAIDMMPEELSGGMHRRVAMARALAACDPRMFLYDEPTSALDPANTEIILKLIGKHSEQGRGFILVSHDVQNAARVANRFLFLRNGLLVFDGAKEDFLRSELSDVRAFATHTM